MKYTQIFILFLLFVFFTSCNGQNKTDLPKDNIKSETKDINTSSGPNNIVRNIIQDRKGNLWMASWEGVFRYDAHAPSEVQPAFINMTSGVSSARFFSLLEDRHGNLWFGSIGSGVYRYDARLNDEVGQGISLPTGQAGFRNFTTRDGLVNNEISCIYEDRAGSIWFGVNGGVNRYDARLNDEVG